MKSLALFAIAALTLSCSFAVDKNNFKTCDQSGFCKRLRPFKPEKSQYTLNLDTVIVHGNVLTAEVTTVDTVDGKITTLVRKTRYFFLSKYSIGWYFAKIFIFRFSNAVKS